MHAQLREAAFGAAEMPGMVVLASALASDERSRLLAAILLGARGTYGPAARALYRLVRGGDPVHASLAASALASHRRQLGGHLAARALDAQALRMLERAGARAADADGLDLAGARADALIGLAADNVGLGRLSAAGALLEAARTDSTGWRSRTRLAWVSAEHALAAGMVQQGIEHAERAVEQAEARCAGRHLAKSRLVLAAALVATGTPEARAHGGELARLAVDAARAAGWRSLIWPGLGLLADLDPQACERHRAEVTRELYALLPAADPQLRRLARGSAWIPL